ncbi:MAG: hypothetical protein ACQKBV_05555 [Puniceicoccales bacterium]
MTPSGWLIMIVSVSAVCGLFAWCMWKVLSTPGESEHMHGFGTEKTPDTDKRA